MKDMIGLGLILSCIHGVEVDSREMVKAGELLAYMPELQVGTTQEVEQDYSSVHQTLDLLSEKVEVLAAQISALEKQQREFMGMISDILTKDQPADSSIENLQYTQALQFMKNQQFASALKALQKYIETYPGAEKTPLAYYWIGEIHTIDGKFDLAISSYHYLLQQHPEHPKASEALYKIGQVYQAKGDKKKSTKAFQDLIERYPQSMSAQLAKDHLVKAK